MDHLFAYLLLVLGTIVCVASLDDLIVDILALYRLGSERLQFLSAEELANEREAIPNTAIFVANWHEAEVLGAMVERNLANFDCDKVQFVLGVYPNDGETLAVARQLQKDHPHQVRVVVNRRIGPTSKGQMLNEIFAQVFADPETAPELVIMHDSEDVIDPRSFVVYARESRQHAMIQIPIFSIDSRHRSLVGSTYMEEFAERHTKELPLREKLGAFVPSAGVGTCLPKDLILHFIAERGHVLQPESVTEDYILGAEAHQAGFSTRFAAYQHVSDKGIDFIATREFFPKDFWPSIRQRTRWTYGIGFEGFCRLGWFGSLANRFFLYRDRKGIVANILPFLSLALLAVVLIVPPDFSQMSPWLLTFVAAILAFNTICILVRVAYKCVAMREVYGDWDLFGIVVRWPLALTINAFAVLRAWRTLITESGMASRPVAWAKTAHELPTDFTAVSVRRAVSAVRERSNNRGLGWQQPRGVAFASIALLCGFLVSPIQVHDDSGLGSSDRSNYNITASIDSDESKQDAVLVAHYQNKMQEIKKGDTTISPQGIREPSSHLAALSLAEAGIVSLTKNDREFFDRLIDPYVVAIADVKRRTVDSDAAARKSRVNLSVEARIHTTAEALAETSVQAIVQNDTDFFDRIASEARRLPAVAYAKPVLPAIAEHSDTSEDETQEFVARSRANSSLIQISEREELFATALEEPAIVSPERLGRIFSERESEFDDGTKLAAFLFDYSLRTEVQRVQRAAAAALAQAEQSETGDLTAVETDEIEMPTVTVLAAKLPRGERSSIQALIELSADESRMLAENAISKIKSDQARIMDAVAHTDNASFTEAGGNGLALSDGAPNRSECR